MDRARRGSTCGSLAVSCFPVSFNLLSRATAPGPLVLLGCRSSVGGHRVTPWFALGLMIMGPHSSVIGVAEAKPD